MNRIPLDIHDEMPTPQMRYIEEYGWHFTRKACDYAVSKMRRLNPQTNKSEKLQPISEEQYKQLKASSGIDIENDIMADGLFVINMAKADYYKRSIPDDIHLVMFVKDYLDDIDGCDGNAMRKWYACCVGAGTPIDWEEMM